MNTTLKWIYPEGASIIDAMLFTRAQERTFDSLILHRRYISTIHDTMLAPPIIYPHWHIYMRERVKPFMVSYPFGLDSTQPYSVRLVLDQISDDNSVGSEQFYGLTIDVRYNLLVTGHRSYHNLVAHKYENVRDYISLAASAQAAFHDIFYEQSRNPLFWAASDLYDNVGDYSSQNTILPYYDAHQLKGQTHEKR